MVFIILIVSIDRIVKCPIGFDHGSVVSMWVLVHLILLIQIHLQGGLVRLNQRTRLMAHKLPLLLTNTERRRTCLASFRSCSPSKALSRATTLIPLGRSFTFRHWPACLVRLEQLLQLPFLFILLLKLTITQSISALLAAITAETNALLGIKHHLHSLYLLRHL